MVFKTGFAPQIVSRAVCTGLASRFDIDSSGVERALAKLVTSGFVPVSKCRRLHSVDVVDRARVNESRSAAIYSTATAPIPAPSFRDCYRRAFTSLPVYLASITNFRYYLL